jgi:hypothetical protein
VILFFTVLFAVVASAAGWLAPDRMRLLVPVTSSASVSEIVFPIGHWIAVVAWAAAVVWRHPSDRRRILYRCIGVGVALDALILVGLFVPRLDDRAAFSAAVYLVYARMFCAMALGLATAWLLGWLQRITADANVMVGLEAPLAAGWGALLIAVAAHSLVMTVAALAIGVVIAGAVRMVRTGSLAGASALARAIATDERAFLVAVCIVAVGLRLLYVTRIMSDPNYLDAGADGRVYDQLGWSIATGEGIPPAFSERFPLLLLGYVWFIAGVYSFAGHSYFALTAVQSILGAGACLLLYRIARRLFGRPTARVAAGFAAVSFPLVFAAATIGHQALDVFLTTLLVCLLLPLITAETRAWRWSAAGVVVGLAFAVRETNIFLLCFLLPWIALTNPGGWRTSFPRLAFFAVAAILVVLPFLAPKMWTRDDRQAMRAHFDRLYRGEGEGRRTTRTDIVGPLADPNAALAQLRGDPAKVIGTLARAYVRNFAVQFLTQPYGGFDLVFLRKGSAYYYGMWFYAYALTVIGTVVAARRIGRGGIVASGAILVLGVIVSRTFPHVILESDYRHRVPVEPLLILLASVGVVALCREVIATAASTSTSGLTGSDWRVSQRSGT